MFDVSLRPRRRRPKVRIPIEDVGAMRWVAKSKFGYDRIIDIPDKKIPAYVEALVNVFGEKQARGMIQAQITFRKNRRRDLAKHKFELMMKYLKKRKKISK